MVKSVQRFELSDRLDTALYKKTTYTFTFSTGIQYVRLGEQVP